MQNTKFVEMMDRLLVETRIRDLAHYALGERENRVARMAAVFSQLSPGWYLIGIGPHFSDIVRVGKDPITFGRSPSLLEEPADRVIDYSVNDATLMGPREVSRVHFSARTSEDGELLELFDEGSSTGTWIGDEDYPIEAGQWIEVESGARISLGGSRTNLFVAIRVLGAG